MAKTFAMVFGVVFVLVGILGFIPNPLVGPTGIFETDFMHNVVHLLFGIILLAVAFAASAASALWLKILGVAYLVIAALGFLAHPEGGMILGLVQTNSADHWLHVLLGVVLVVVGFMTSSKPAATPVSTL